MGNSNIQPQIGFTKFCNFIRQVLPGNFNQFIRRRDAQLAEHFLMNLRGQAVSQFCP